MKDRVQDWLQSAGLGHCAENFVGIDERKFLSLAMADYAELHITSMLERKRLFSLIQALRREGVKPESSSSGNDGSTSTAIPACNISGPTSSSAISSTCASVPLTERESKENQRPVETVASVVPTPAAAAAPTIASSSISSSSLSTRQELEASPLKRPSTFRLDNNQQQQPPQSIIQQHQQQQPSSQLPYNDRPIRPAQQQQHDLEESLQDDEDGEDGSYMYACPPQAKPQRSRPPIPKLPQQQPQILPFQQAQVIDLSKITRRGDRIRVTVRKRPMIKKEVARGETDVIETDNVQSITVIEPKTKVDLTKYVETHEFFFDGVFNEYVSNEQIYDKACKPLVGYVFQQGKATCFAYGQTGAGKTFTMMGNSSSPGLYMLAARDIFHTLPQHSNLCVWVSFYEIYGGKLYDLLNERKRLIAREDGAKNVNICGLEERQVQSVDELISAMDFGNAARSTACTGANVDSSRSHAILSITLRDKKDKRVNQSSCHGKFSFIDLAGSERASDTTDNDRQTRIESAEINKSLLALKECIRALDQDHRHIPFRGSKLTEVLRDSFVGECRTVMIANVAPNTSSCEHTMNTLRYAYRVKELRKPGAAQPGEGLWDDLTGAPPALPSPSSAALTPPIQSAIPEKEKPIIRHRPAAVITQARPKTSPGQRSWGETNPLAAAAAASDQHQQQQQQQAQSGNNSKATMIEQTPMAPYTAALIGRRASCDDIDVFTPASSVEEELDDSIPFDGEEDELARTHEELAHNILNEEDNVIASHRRQIEDNMDLVHKEMLLLQSVEMPGGNIDDYVTSLDRLLVQKLEMVQQMRQNLAQFREHLKEEERISQQLNRRSP